MGQGNDHRSQQIQIEGVLTFLGAAQYTSMGSAVHLTDSPASGVVAPGNARIALIQAEVQNLRWTGGTTANFTLSSSVGMLLSTAMDHLVYNAATNVDGSPNWGSPTFIGVAGGAIMNVQYFM
jgi:hypothetical protein